MFPILFALIIGRTTHALLRWRLELGTYVGTLDTLAASTSFTSTIVSQFQLRSYSVLGVILVLLWALSPIGGQASIRQMTIGTDRATTLATFNYLALSGELAGFLNTSRKSMFAIIDTMFISSLTASTASRSSPQDIWGNIKIPLVEYYETRERPDGEGWFDSTDGELESYASTIGIPISGFNSTGFAKYSTRVQTSYLQAVCSMSTWDISEIGKFSQPTNYKNYTGSGAAIYYDDDMQANRTRTDPQSREPFVFQYRTLQWGENNHQVNCSLKNSYVEAEVICPQSTSCAATRVRRSQWEAPPSSWTFLDLFFANYELLFGGLINSVDGKLGWPTLLDRYISDPAQVVKTTDVNLFTVNLTTEENYSKRMSQLLNAYFICLNGMPTIPEGINNITAYHVDQNGTFIPPRDFSRNGSFNYYQMIGDVSETRGRAWAINGTQTTSREVIIAHIPWVITLCVISIVLILASLVSPLVRIFFIRGPEVLMNVSSLATRNNPYISLPEGGSHLGASARARLLKKVEVRFGDVERPSNVGKLAIGSLRGADERCIESIEKGRMYE